MKTEETNEIDAMLIELQKYIDELNKAMMNEVPKELREANKKYQDIIKLAGELNANLK